MNNVFATVIIQAQYQPQAQEELQGHFTAEYSETGSEPATHYVDSGFWFDSEMDMIVNETEWPKIVRFGDPQQAIDALGLKKVEPKPEKDGDGI
jgi:hypothetical protein